MRPAVSAPHRSGPRLLARRTATAPILHTGLVVLAVGGLLVALMWPLLTQGTRLKGDYPTDTWLIMHQAESLKDGIFPSHFLHSNGGIFYPVFAFYGGTLFAIAGAITLIVGSAWTTQALVYVLALGAAYGGWVWLARLAGLRSWQVHAPAVLYVTAPYVMTNAIVRQDLTEAVATSMIPLLLASGLSVLRADRLRAGPAAALAASAILLGGSHNLTLLWGLTIFGPVVLVLVAAVPQIRRMVTRRGLLRVLAVIVPAMAVNAWYLLPDIAYYSHTLIFDRIDDWKEAVRNPGPALEAKYLFSVSRTSAFGGSDFTLALPVLAIGWVLLAAVVVVRRQWRDVWARTLAVVSVLSIAVLLVMTHPRLITVLPDPWQMIQFSYRLESFALVGICGAVIAALVLVNHSGHRWLSLLLVPIMAFSVFGAVKQARDVPLYESAVVWTIDRLYPFSTGDFADASEKPHATNAQVVVLTRQDVHRDHLATTVNARPGEVVYLDLMTSPQLVDIGGARVIGRWAVPPTGPATQPRWYLAVRVDDDATPGKARITVREARTLPIVGGRIITILGLLGLAANAVAIVLSRRRRGRRTA
jgi:hypothetical protein